MRRALLIALIATAACARPERLRFPQAPVVLISIDTLRADHLPAYGYGGVATPVLDRFRADAILFKNAWSPCPMTLPSHVTMLTGLQPPRHGVRTNAGFTFDGRRHASLPALLKQRGYATGAAVSSYVLRAETGLGMLFDDYDDAIDPRPGAAFADYQRAGGAAVAAAGRWVAVRREQPFFYFLHLYEPHVPYEPPEPFKSRYASAYDGEVAAADALVGQFLDGLRRDGLYDRALIIVTSDHGEGLGDHGEDQHSILLYREALQVPLLVKLPGGKRSGATVEAPAQLADIAPTVLALVATPGAASDGLLLLDLENIPPRQLYGETLYPRLHLGWSELRSLVGEHWHYIHGPRPELYDLRDDPAEKRDLAGHEQKTAEGMRRALEAWPFEVPQPSPVEREAAERLAALGYVGQARARAGPLPNPRDSLAYLGRIREGLQLAARKRFDAAVAALRGIVAENPAMAEVWIQLGDVLGQAGRFVEAAAAYDQALAQGPPSADIVLARGMVRLKAGRLGDAEQDAKRARLELPVQSRELLARIALARGRGQEALGYAQAAATAKGPTPPSALLVLAEVRARTGDLPGALASLDQAERQAATLGLSQPFGLDFLRADTLARLDRPHEAEAAYRREIEAHPGHTQAYANLAVLLFLQRRRDAIEPLFEEMVRRNPDPAAYRLAAVTYEALGDRARAAAWRRRQPPA